MWSVAPASPLKTGKSVEFDGGGASRPVCVCVFWREVACVHGPDPLQLIKALTQKGPLFLCQEQYGSLAERQ